MKKIFLGIFALIGLSLLNFGSAGNILSQFDNYKIGNYTTPKTDINYTQGHLYCIEINSDLGYNEYLNATLPKITWGTCQPDVSGRLNVKGVYCFVSCGITNGSIGAGQSNINANFDIYDFTDGNFPNGGGSCDYTEYEQTISTLSGNLATCNSNISTLSGNLATCQTDLTTCQNSNTCNPTGTCTVNNKLAGNIIYSGTVNLNSSSYTNIFNYGNNGAGTYCVKLTSTNAQQLQFGFANGGTTAPSNLYTLYNDQYNNRVCLYGNKAYFNAKLSANTNTVNYEVYKLTDLLNDNIPCEENNTSCDYSEYEQTISTLSGNLATCEGLYNSCDINYNSCTEELNLCMSGTVSGSGTQRSALFINNTQHIGAGIINLTIPEEINRNYEYVNEEMDIDVVGYNVDEEYITNIIQKEKLTPTKEDFTYLIENLGGYIPLLCVAGLVIYAWYIIRKVF